MLNKDLNKPAENQSRFDETNTSKRVPSSNKQTSHSIHPYGEQIIISSLNDQGLDSRTFSEKWSLIEKNKSYTYARTLQPVPRHLKYVKVDFAPMGLPLSDSSAPLDLTNQPMPPTQKGMLFYDALEYNPEGPTDEAILLSVLNEEIEKEDDSQDQGFFYNIWLFICIAILGLSQDQYVLRYPWFTFTSANGRNLDANRRHEAYQSGGKYNLDILGSGVAEKSVKRVTKRYHKGKTARPFVQSSLGAADSSTDGFEMQNFIPDFH
ncbi:unnamed protein product [Kuraishia capsulata CBS 1993]|uniref:Uncharacterized protein n=1 Tax=Kuraishia capsulata CBS 1993 TaxID=1382522 RepID=W6MJ60_9ASCO|nr:uncharacterized protein KUCA_T00000425001 [Kuraishia capsulata CBS 1993]CDK24462.1 unnamed protein product [Kuraishia capsulata CBS 1993]